jgi:hypothetical protein
MRKLALGLVAASFIAAPVLAQTPLTFADVDANGDGRLSYDLTAEEFAAADAEGVGGLTPEQLNMLQPASVPAPAEAVPAPLEAPAPTDSLTN